MGIITAGALNDPAMRPFPLAAVTPRGWLADQLRLQADGLSGHLDEFWPEVKDSAWIGGGGEGWERMPYWLDGAIPLAWLTGDEPLKQRLLNHLDHIITHQHADGWIGPGGGLNGPPTDLWSLFLALKMLVVHHDATGDDRVPGVVARALRMLDRRIDQHPLSHWAQFRWFEALVSIWWLYDRTREEWLVDLAVKLHAQGFHWTAYIERWPHTTPTEKGRWNFAGHVVNNAMAIKQGGLWWRLTGDERDRRAPRAMLDALDRHHGMPTGAFTGDECLAGTEATQGTELCAVAETMYSLECLVATLGDVALADRLESLAFNALPAAFRPDMWAHQYDQQVNQVECSVREGRPWNSNGPDSNIYGLEPQCGCCTANFSQAWPKLSAHLWMQTADGGIAAVVHAPSRLQTTIHGVPVVIELATEYPFRSRLQYTVRTGGRVAFPLHLRIPGWAEDASIRTSEDAPTRIPAGVTMHRIDRAWEGETRIVVDLPMQPRLLPRPRGAVSIARGPLVYALPIGEDWRRINVDHPLRQLPHGDWEVHPTTPWNYALLLNDGRPADPLTFEERPLVMPVFSPGNAPVSATVAGRRVPEWTAVNGSAGPTPASPVRSNEPPESLTLIPYGCTNLRIAEFPVLG